jgi:hypothetical protein
MKSGLNQRKGQVFSIDVLFALLPIIMIIGASLQYLYIAEEDMKTLSVGSRRDLASSGMGDFLIAKYMDNPDYVEGSDCPELQSLVDGYAVANDYSKYYFVWDYNNETRLCTNTAGYNADWIAISNSTASSEERFLLEHDPGTGEIKPGEIVGVSIVVEEDIP